MTTPRDITATVAVIGGGVLGAAVLYTLAHRGVRSVLLERDTDLAYAASGTNSGILHTGFDSTPGELETDLILRSAKLRPTLMEALQLPVMRCGADLVPRTEEDREMVRSLAKNARTNGVEVRIRESDGALLVPGESLTDPVAYTLALARSAEAAGAQVEVKAEVSAIDVHSGGLLIHLADGRQIQAQVAVNCAGLHADDVARMVGDDTFEIYPRKGEFLVFELPVGKKLDRIILPVPTKQTKGVLVFPTVDGRVIAGPTAVDLEDKNDWSVRPEAHREVLEKAVVQLPALRGLTPLATYAGLRPAGRGSNYVISPSMACGKLINVAAVRSTGLSASLGVAAYVSDLLPELGVHVGKERPTTPIENAPASGRWWERSVQRHSVKH